MRLTRLFFALASLSALSACGGDIESSDAISPRLDIEDAIQLVGDSREDGVYAILRDQGIISLPNQTAEWAGSFKMELTDQMSRAGLRRNLNSELAIGECYHFSESDATAVGDDSLNGILIVGVDAYAAPATSDVHDEGRNVFCAANFYSGLSIQTQDQFTYYDTSSLGVGAKYVVVRLKSDKASRPRAWVVAVDQ